MTKGLSGNLYTQANAGILRNLQHSTYANIGASVGGNAKMELGKGFSIIGGAEIGAGTALTASAKLGYQIKIKNNSNVVFTVNAAYDKSLNKNEKVEFNAEHHFSVTDNITEVNKTNYINDTLDYKPSNLRIFGQMGYNKDTKWGGYEVGLEGGYSRCQTGNFDKKYTSTINVELNGQTYSEEQVFTYHREQLNDDYVSPYAKAKINLNKSGDLQAIGKADLHNVQAGIRYTF